MSLILIYLLDDIYIISCIQVDTQWRKVQDRLEDDERCSRLEKFDRLEIFQEYIRDLEKEEDEQRKIKKVLLKIMIVKIFSLYP